MIFNDAFKRDKLSDVEKFDNLSPLPTEKIEHDPNGGTNAETKTKCLKSSGCFSAAIDIGKPPIECATATIGSPTVAAIDNTS
ncbi:hypothetical protein NBRC116583_17830 [Arenicella sp. 4NH20-0111]